jgi:hypothetical protein
VDGKVFLQASIPNGTHFWDLKKKKWHSELNF